MSISLYSLVCGCINDYYLFYFTWIFCRAIKNSWVNGWWWMKYFSHIFITVVKSKLETNNNSIQSSKERINKHDDQLVNKSLCRIHFFLHKMIMIMISQSVWLDGVRLKEFITFIYEILRRFSRIRILIWIMYDDSSSPY